MLKHVYHIVTGTLTRSDTVVPGAILPFDRPSRKNELFEENGFQGSLSPCSFYMDAARQFRAFEFKKGLDMVVPGEEFLEEFGSFLHIHQLGDVSGITMWSPGKEQ